MRFIEVGLISWVECLPASSYLRHCQDAPPFNWSYIWYYPKKISLPFLYLLFLLYWMLTLVSLTLGIHVTMMGGMKENIPNHLIDTHFQVGRRKKKNLPMICCCSVAHLCPTLQPMACSMPGFPVLHYLPKFAQTHAHWACDVIQLFHPLLPPPALSLSQHQGLYQWVGSWHQVAKVLKLQNRSFQ